MLKSPYNEARFCQLFLYSAYTGLASAGGNCKKYQTTMTVIPVKGIAKGIFSDRQKFLSNEDGYVKENHWRPLRFHLQ